MQKALHLMHDTEQAVFTFKRTQRWRDAAKVRNVCHMMTSSGVRTGIHTCCRSRRLSHVVEAAHPITDGNTW